MSVPASQATEPKSAQQLWIVLARCNRALGLVAEDSIAGSGLGLTDFMVLESLLHKGPLTITQIQDKVLLASGSMTAAIDRLERQGWLIRTTTAEDRRARVLELTSAGRQVIRTAFARHAKDLEAAMDILTAGERKQLYALARRLGRSVAEKRNTHQQAQHA
jgi:MarR family 2-MHQ and catechol resistance regulon transcriptional repressor